MATITNLDNKRNVEVQKGAHGEELQTSLSKIGMTFSCRDGSCRGCTMEIVTGRENITILDPHKDSWIHQQADYRAMCVSTVSGDIQIATPGMDESVIAMLKDL